MLPDDAEWLLEQCAAAPTEEARRVYTDTVYYIGLGDGESFGLVWSAAQTNPLLRERFAPQWAPVLLGSEQAEQARKWYRHSQERERRDSEKSKGLAKLVTYIKRELVAFYKGDLDAWWRLNQPLTATQVENDGRYWPNDLLLDFTETECWKAYQSWEMGGDVPRFNATLVRLKGRGSTRRRITLR